MNSSERLKHDLVKEIKFMRSAIMCGERLTRDDATRIEELLERAQKFPIQIEKSETQPEWQDRAVELRKQGHEYTECAEILNREGFVSKHKKRITVDMIRNRFSNLKTGRVKS